MVAHSIAIIPPTDAPLASGLLVAEVFLMGMENNLQSVALNMYPEEGDSSRQFFRQLFLVGNDGNFGQLITEVHCGADNTISLRVWHVYRDWTYELVLRPPTAKTLREQEGCNEAIFRLLLLRDILFRAFTKS